MSFIIYLASLVLITYLGTLAWMWCEKGVNRSKSITRRLLPCSLRLILISYATFTSGLFSLVSCVPFHPPRQVLFIDGSIDCYKPWQYAIMLLIACWLILFPFGLYMTSWMLHRKHISAKVLVFLLTCPLGAIFYWIYVRYNTCRWSNRELSDDASLIKISQEVDNLQAQATSDELLNVLEGPFRKSQGGCMDQNFKLPWEIMLITKRLILIVIKTFIFNVVLRLYIMLLVTVLFLIQHLIVRPFSDNILNYIEVGSFLMLTAICALNILPAYNYMYHNCDSPFSKTILIAFMRIETGLTLVFPFVLGCCLAVLLCVRMFQIITWLFCGLVRIIHFCSKRKSS